MNIVVCVKQIPDPAEPGALDPSTNTLKRDSKLILDEADSYGVEMALQLAGDDGEVTLVSMAPNNETSGLRTALAMGAAKAVLVSDEALAHLQKLPALNFVKLYGTKVTLPAVEKFQAATGLTKVDHRKGAFLGVGCQSFDGTCLISTVHENSPAERAGLLRDDQLVRFGDAKVVDFESLTAEISRRDSGDEIEIEVQRQVLNDEGRIVLRSIVTKATLGPWEQELAVQNGMRP